MSSWRLAGAVALRAGLLACSGSWSFSVKGCGPRAWGVAHRACKAPECCRHAPRAEACIPFCHSPPLVPDRFALPWPSRFSASFSRARACEPPPSLPLKFGSDGGLSALPVLALPRPLRALQRQGRLQPPPRTPLPFDRLGRSPPSGRGPCPPHGFARHGRHPGAAERSGLRRERCFECPA